MPELKNVIDNKIYLLRNFDTNLKEKNTQT